MNPANLAAERIFALETYTNDFTVDHRRERGFGIDTIGSVSYTHLTLPTMQ